jgi:redox-sensitive bicupin YhaK (pirin superfamily)
MINRRHRDERGPTKTGWLNSMHSFSFGHYHDPRHMGFGPLRVINEDRVIPGGGFATHGHQNMEIISYVLSGQLAHKDSMGNGSTIKPGDVQLMSAGSGVTHSEFNGSNKDEVHFLQIWIMPNVENEAPGYQETSFAESSPGNQFRLVVSPDGESGSLKIKQDARMLVGVFEEEQTHTLSLDNGRRYWLQVARGIVLINGDEASAGDGFAIEHEETVGLDAVSDAELILFDLP